MKLYKIRNTETDLYSTGGMEPRFTKKGKVWTGRNYIKNHFNLLKEEFNSYKYRGGEHLIEKAYEDKLLKIYGNCVVEKYDFETHEKFECSIKDFLNGEL